MEIFKIENFLKIKNPNPGQRFRLDTLTKDKGMENLGGIFGLLDPGSQVPYHYHKIRESVLIGLSGEAIEIVEGKEIPFKTNDVFYIAPGEKHATVNRGNQQFCYLEFFTYPPVEADFIEL